MPHSFHSSALPAVGCWFFPRAVSPSGRKMDMAVPFPNSPAQREKDRLFRHFLLGAFPEATAAHWQRWVTHLLFHQPCRGSRAVASLTQTHPMSQHLSQSPQLGLPPLPSPVFLWGELPEPSENINLSVSPPCSRTSHDCLHLLHPVVTPPSSFHDPIRRGSLARTHLSVTWVPGTAYRLPSGQSDCSCAAIRHHPVSTSLTSLEAPPHPAMPAPLFDLIETYLAFTSAYKIIQDTTEES